VNLGISVSPRRTTNPLDTVSSVLPKDLRSLTERRLHLRADMQIIFIISTLELHKFGMVGPDGYLVMNLLGHRGPRCRLLGNYADWFTGSPPSTIWCFLENRSVGALHVLDT
jgi:hypothetical protein